MADQWIRDYLKQRNSSLTDNDITYDNGAVKVKGQFFTSATPAADGKTYGSSAQLDNAYNSYNNQNQLDQLRNMANTPNPQTSELLKQIQQRMNQPQQQFSYNAQNDPLYQNALQAAQQGAQTATNNALVQLGRRGIGNSSSSTTQAAGIQQNAIGRVNSEILPQLQQQAYQRYQGEQQNLQQQLANMMDAYRLSADQDQSKFNNLGKLLGFDMDMNQRKIDNERNSTLDAYNQQQDRIRNAQWGINTYGYGEAKNDPGVFFNQYAGAKPIAVQQIESQMALQELQKAIQESGVTGYYKDSPTMQKIAQDFSQWAERQGLAIRQQEANTSAARASGGGSSVTQKRYTDQQGQRAFEGNVMSEISQLGSSQEINDWLEMNRGEIVRQLGTSGFEQVRKSALSGYQQEAKQTQQQSKDAQALRKQAISYVSKLPEWFSADENQRESLIQEYMNLLR